MWSPDPKTVKDAQGRPVLLYTFESSSSRARWKTRWQRFLFSWEGNVQTAAQSPVGQEFNMGVDIQNAGVFTSRLDRLNHAPLRRAQPNQRGGEPIARYACP